MSKKTPAGKFYKFDHLTFWVGNAVQAATYYVGRFGFSWYAYRGLETGSKHAATWVVRQGDIIFAFSSPYKKNQEMADHEGKHGDGVKDVAFTVDNATAIYEAAIANGAISVSPPITVDGLTMASVKTYGDTTHTFIQRQEYKGHFLPGFIDVSATHSGEPFYKITEPVSLLKIDHVVGNQDWNGMDSVVNWYKEKLGFIQFWSVDEKQIHTEFSALRSVVVCDVDENVKMPLNEPAKGKKKSQIEEYVEFYGGPGVQHIALKTDDILKSVSYLKQRGVQFLTIPSSYYENLRKRLENSKVHVKEDLEKIKSLNILVDFDDDGYLLQIFTKPVEDRPTLFIEIIQRANNSGFGVGNFKALFISIEEEQMKRGNLTSSEESAATK